MRGLGYMTVSEILETMHENDLFNIFPEFYNDNSNNNILAVIPATSCSAKRSFIALRRLKAYLRSTMEQQLVSNITLINLIEKAYANSVLNNDMDRIIDMYNSFQNFGKTIKPSHFVDDRQPLYS